MAKEKVNNLAAEFASQLKVSPFFAGDNWQEMRALNATPEYGDDICASHNFCDSNVIMDSAFSVVFGRPADPASEADNAIWSESWTLAKREYLTA